MGKIQTIEKLFTFILVYSYLIIPFFFLFNKDKKNRALILVAIYGVLFFLFLQFYYDIPKDYRKIQQTVYTTLEFSFFASIFWITIKNSKVRNIILILWLLFTLYQVTYYFLSPLQKIDSVPVGIETILIFTFAFLYFQQYFKTNLTGNIYDYSSFWLVVGIVIYLGSSFFFNILVNHVTQKQIEEYWHFTYLPEIFKNVLFTLVASGLFFNKVEFTKMKSKDIPNLDMI